MHLISAPRNLLISFASIHGAKISQTVRKLQELSIEWRKERAGRNFKRFRPNWPSDAT
jgi:hypothetical protein